MSTSMITLSMIGAGVLIVAAYVAGTLLIAGHKLRAAMRELDAGTLNENRLVDYDRWCARWAPWLLVEL